MVDVTLTGKNTDAEDFAFEEYAEEGSVAQARDVELCKRRVRDQKQAPYICSQLDRFGDGNILKCW